MMKKWYTLPLKYNTKTWIKFSCTLGLTANTDLETIRTPAVHKGFQLLDFLKNGAQLRLFWKQRGSHATVPLQNVSTRQGFYQAILKKKFGLRTYIYCVRSEAWKRWNKQAEACRPLTWGEPLAVNNSFATEAIWRSSFRAFSQHLREIVGGEEIITAQ